MNLELEDIVDVAFAAGRESLCEELGHDWRDNDSSGQEDGQFDIRCARCGKRFKE